MKKKSEAAILKDTNETIKFCNEILKAAGKKPLYENMEELEKLMISNEPIKL